MLFADKDDLTDMVGVVGADVRDDRGVFGELLVVGGFDGLLPIGHDLVELVNERVPLLGVVVVEGLVVIAAEGRGLFAFEPGERGGVPEDEVVSELPDGVVPFAIGPLGLVGGKTLDSDVAGDEPIFFVVGGS